jgi:hypothetical protein
MHLIKILYLFVTDEKNNGKFKFFLSYNALYINFPPNFSILIY